MMPAGRRRGGNNCGKPIAGINGQAKRGWITGTVSEITGNGASGV